MEVIAPPTLDSPLLNFCDGQGLSVLEVGDYGTYPHTDMAVMQFDGDIFCYVASWADRTVHDPETNEIRRCDFYSTPVAWAAYENPAPKPQPTSNERLYTVMKGERLFHIARKLGMSESELIEHNDLPDPYSIAEGTTLHVPLPLKNTQPQVTYEVYSEPKLMHIANPGGAHKWAFGNAKTEKDIISGSGTYPENKEIIIVGQAQVPIKGETFVYYMDQLAMGDYDTTGKVTYQIGFSWRHLKPGPAPAAQPAAPVSIAQQITETIAAIETPAPAPAPAPAPVTRNEHLPNPDKWKGSYVPFLNNSGANEPLKYVVDLPEGEEDILVYDHDGKKPQRRVRDSGHYLLAGVFWKDGVKYGRPWQSVNVETAELRNWYGLPMNVMKTEQQFYDDQPDLHTKLAFNHSSLTPLERYVIPSFALTKLSYDRLKLYGKNIKGKYNKEKS